MDISPEVMEPPAPPPLLEAPAPPRRGRPLVLGRAPVARDSIVPGVAVAGADTSGRAARGRAGADVAAWFRPRASDPRLLVRPMLIPQDGGRPLDMDSVVRVRLLAMADSLERSRASDPDRPRSWTFERNGRTYGLDAEGLHLGGVTIPSVLLALLPLPQGNVGLAEANERLNAMRADILRAAARAQAEADFQRAVREIRERWNREREERRSRGEERPPTIP
jgi:hypothetical protein